MHTASRRYVQQVGGVVEADPLRDGVGQVEERFEAKHGPKVQ